VNGAERICTALSALGVRHVFGLPGTQNVLLYEALRTSGLRSIVASDEGAAAFMAAGLARASGTVGVLTTIPGPGFVYALAGVAEARHDSVPLLWLTLRQHDTGQAFQLQRIDQAAMAAPVVKQCFLIEHAGELDDTVRRAHCCAVNGEPGPVLVEVTAPVLSQHDVPGRAVAVDSAVQPVDTRDVLRMLAASERPLIFAGQGAQGAAVAVRALAHRLRAPVLFTCSGRGVVPDSDPLALVRDFSFGMGDVVPALIARADLILALGCKFTHNGSSGGRLPLPQDKLIRIDSSADVLAANYPARLAIPARVEDVLPSLDRVERSHSGWSDGELAAAREQLAAERATPIAHEPVVDGTVERHVSEFFGALSRAAGEHAVYTADAGLHQALTRKYAQVLRPRGLLCPSDFQSMGFGLPGAIGAVLAQPDACVFACIGDGGLVQTAGELLTAVREGLDLVVVVFNDGALGLIRRQQVEDFGYASGVALHSPNYAALAEAVGCSYFPVTGDLDALARQIVQTPGVRLVELRLRDTDSFQWKRLKHIVRHRAQDTIPESAWQVVKQLLHRSRSTQT
jgi:acetolactate synthase-1/2/3 large subunit